MLGYAQPLEGKIQKIIIEKGHVAYVEVAVLCSNQLKNAEIASFSCFFHICLQFSVSPERSDAFFYKRNTSFPYVRNSKKVRKLLFLFNGKNMVQQFFVSNVFVPFICVEHEFLKIDLPNMGIYHQKMHEMHCFHFFVNILAGVYSSLRFTDA